TPVNDRYAKGMHAVPPPMTGNYMPSGPDVEMDYSKFTYGPKQTLANELDAKTSENATCESDSSVETTTSMHAPAEDAPKVVSKPKVWTDAPIIEEYELDSDDDLENVQETCTPNHCPKVEKWVNAARPNNSSQAASTSTASKVNTARPFDDPHKALKDKGIVDSRCSRHMTWNKAHLADYQEFKGGSVAFGGSNGRITGKETIKAGRLGHVNFKNLNNLVKRNLVRGLPSKIFENNHISVACQKAKQHKASCKAKTDETTPILRDFIRQAENQFNHKVKTIRSENRTQFKNHDLIEFCGLKGIKREYSNARTLQQNRVVERKNMTLIEEELEKLKIQEKEAYDAARKEATQKTQNANTNSTNLLNVVSTPVSAVGPSRAFNDGEPSYLDDPSMAHLEEIYASPSEWIFTNSSYDDEGVVTDFNNLETTVNVSPTPITRIHTIHPKTQILRDPMLAVQIRSKVHKNSEAHALVSYIQKQLRNNHNEFQHCLFACFLSQFEPKKISQALEDESLVDAMQEELLQNKKDEKGVVVKNKARLVSQGQRQEEGIDYDEVFAPVARIEAIRIFLVFASFMGFVVYQMDMKSAFIYGTIDEEVYVTQPPGFIDLKFPHKVYKAVKALYGLHQAPRAWLSRRKMVSSLVRIIKDEEAADVDVTPKTSPLQAVKRIFRYLKGQPKLGLWYPKASLFDLEAYSDSDYAGANLDMKSTTEATLVKGRLFEVTTAKHWLMLPSCWFSNHTLDSYQFTMSNQHQELASPGANGSCKELASPRQTDLGVNTPRCDEDSLELKELMVFFVQFILRKMELELLLLKVNAANIKLQLLRFMLLMCLSAKTTSWNEFSSTIASAIICFATNQKFNFSRYILLSLVKNIEAGVPFFMFPRKQQPIVPKVPSPAPSPEHQLPSPSNDPIPDADKVNLKFQELVDLCTRLSNKVLDLKSEAIDIKFSFTDKIAKLEDWVHQLEEENRGRMIAEMNEDVKEESQVKAYNLDLQHSEKVLSMQDTDEEEPVEVEEVLEVVKAAKLMTEVVTTAAPTTIVAQVPKAKVKPKDRGKGILIEETKPLKRQAQIKQDEAFARQLEAELNANINWNDVIEQDIAKKQRMDEEKEELKSHPHIVANDDDDVFIEATPLASNVPVVDYQIHHENNKPYYKIIRADGTHKLFLSFITLLKNFDREDLETLWKLVKEIFESTKPKNFLDDFFLNILKIMFEKPNVEANV
nr:hypothetical protein [Tanacetum cinerariifolium]